MNGVVCSHISGGLGNQMFQYAAGRAVAKRLSARFCLDTSDFLNYGLHHGFELENVFAAPVDLIDSEVMRGVLGWQSSKLVKNLLARDHFKYFRSSSYIVEPHFNYWSGVRNLHAPIYLRGYWQSESYFEEFEKTIREEFSFKTPMSESNLEISKYIDGSNAISLHVRRGDYASNAKTNATHGVCTLDYYRHAINYVVERVKSPCFFVFSDDIAWVKENLKVPTGSVYVEHNTGKKSYNDMRLMSMCDHHIIANSSFSWWGAWLAQHEGQIVVAPKPWFDSSEYDSTDLIPSRWTLIQK